MIDITNPDVLEILISKDGKTIWINGEDSFCILRACRIKRLILNDERLSKRETTDDRETRFRKWMHDVDMEVGIAAGLSILDLPDQDYRAAFDDDISPKEFTSSILSEIKKGGKKC